MKSVLILVGWYYFLQAKCVQCVLIDYYWRDYTGVVPTDAVPGGRDLNHEATYIGQGFVRNEGIIPGVIYPGKKEMAIPSHGGIKTDTYIKILCSPNPSAFNWVLTTERDFHTKMIEYLPVKGGFENNYDLNIGRIAYQGEIITGKLVTWSPDYTETVPMFFVYKGKENKIGSYEVLVYDNSTLAIDVRTRVKTQ